MPTHVSRRIVTHPRGGVHRADTDVTSYVDIGESVCVRHLLEPLRGPGNRVDKHGTAVK